MPGAPLGAATKVQASGTLALSRLGIRRYSPHGCCTFTIPRRSKSPCRQPFPRCCLAPGSRRFSNHGPGGRHSAGRRFRSRCSPDPVRFLLVLPRTGSGQAHGRNAAGHSGRRIWKTSEWNSCHPGQTGREPGVRAHHGAKCRAPHAASVFPQEPQCGSDRNGKAVDRAGGALEAALGVCCAGAARVASSAATWLDSQSDRPLHSGPPGAGRIGARPGGGSENLISPGLA